MVQSYDPQTGVLFLNAVSGTGVTVEQALDAVMAALTEGANIVIANNDATNTITIGTSALNQAQVDDRIMDQLPTATSFQATSTSNTNRLAWTPERVMQSARVAMTGRTDNAPLDLSDPASESNINFTSRRTITQTIADNMGGERFRRWRRRLGHPRHRERQHSDVDAWPHGRGRYRLARPQPAVQPRHRCRPRHHDARQRTHERRGQPTGHRGGDCSPRIAVRETAYAWPTLGVLWPHRPSSRLTRATFAHGKTT